MIYKFIGENKSMGLKKGKKYNVLINVKNEKVFAYIQLKFTKTIVCTYDSMDLFLDNWKQNDIIHINLGNADLETRAIDKLGHITIPKKFRKELNIKEKDELRIFLLENGLYIPIYK